MNAAINNLEIQLGILETNEPINRENGNFHQADSEAKGAAEIRQALYILNAVKKASHPIWPEPKVS